MLRAAWKPRMRGGLSLDCHLWPKKGSKVTVAMSGGVDSSVTAGLLSRNDYDLSAVFMRNWDTRDESGTDTGCEWEKDWEDVQRVCKVLDIPCKLVDLSREYWTRVFEPSLHAWERGQTPNPDIWCNKEVKFGSLVHQLSTTNTWMATGHYASKDWLVPDRKDAHSILARAALCRPRDRNKDQTYYLAGISETSLERALFPLEDLEKSQVRELAHQWKLPVADRPESMGICFVGEKRRFQDFLSQYIPPNPGKIVHAETQEVVGTHEGLWNFTIGQGARLRGHAQRLFVSAKDVHENIIYVVPGSDHPDLYKSKLTARGWQWIWANSPPLDLGTPLGARVSVQFAHRMPDVRGYIRRDRSTGATTVEFDELQKGIAPGQVAVVWDGEQCLGCGVIESTE